QMSSYSNNFHAIFAVDNPSADVTTWQWRYVGVLAGPAEHQQLEGHQHWTGIDLVRKSDGTLLTVISPADKTSSGDIHYGCRVLQTTSLEPPALARDGSGNLIVLAKATASDLPSGPQDRCVYEPSSNTGLLLGRRLINDPTLGTRVTINRTGL